MRTVQRFDEEISREFIAVPDEDKSHLVFKWPDHEIRRFTRAIIDADEEAVFIKQGNVVAVLGPGRHQLDANELPFLGALADHASGGRAYDVELYFVGTKEYVGQGFGGVVDEVRDPETRLAVELRVYGDFAVRVVEPVALLTKLVGTVNLADPELVHAWLSDQVLKALRTWLVTQIVGQFWPVLGLATHVAEIEAATVDNANAALGVYGLQVTRLGNVTVSPAPEDAQRLRQLSDAQAFSAVAGGFGAYAAGEALIEAGKGMAKGGGEGIPLIAAGLGLGGGLGAGLLAASNPTSQISVAPPPASTTSVPATTSPSPVATTDASVTEAPAGFCTHCGHPMAAGDLFCAHCGQAVRQP